MDFRIIAFGSKDYLKTLELRDRILRIPLGLNLTEVELKSDPEHIHLGAFKDGQLLACLILVPYEDGSVKMRQVAVDDLLQGQGIGSALVEFAESHTRQLGSSLIWCHARDVAKPFYDKLGYVQIGEGFEEVGILHYKLQKQL